MKLFGTIFITAIHLVIIFVYPLWAINTFLGVIVAAIAHSKGRSFNEWWVYATFILIVAFIHSLIIRPDNEVIENRQLDDGMVRCKFCAELIKKEAIVCRFCGNSLHKNIKSEPNPAIIPKAGIEQLFTEASETGQRINKEKNISENKPNPLKEWVKKNPNKSIHDYYREKQSAKLKL